jgi:hypothetical protein
MIYTGIGSSAEDGIFSFEQKLAAKHASGLTSDELELYMGNRRQDDEMQGDNGEQQVVANQLAMLSLTEPYEALKKAEEQKKPPSLSSFFFGNIQPESKAQAGGFDLFAMAAGSSAKRSADVGQ